MLDVERIHEGEGVKESTDALEKIRDMSDGDRELYGYFLLTELLKSQRENTRVIQNVMRTQMEILQELKRIRRS